MNNEELDGIVLESSFEVDGTKRMRCETAFRLAEKHGVTPGDIGESCNRAGVKIVACQLGCFA